MTSNYLYLTPDYKFITMKHPHSLNIDAIELKFIVYIHKNLTTKENVPLYVC